MKRLFSILILSSFLLTGCGRELVREENIIDSVTVSEIKYEPESSYTVFTKVGQVTVPIKHSRSESYNIIFDYKGTKLSYDDKNIYNQFKDKLGSVVECEMNMKVYSDNSFDIEILNFIGSDNNE